jgi:hypothetical protein
MCGGGRNIHFGEKSGGKATQPRGLIVQRLLPALVIAERHSTTFITHAGQCVTNILERACLGLNEVFEAHLWLVGD